MKNLPRNPRFMYSALSAFSPADVTAYFESLGVPLKTERGNRVFPVSDKAEDVVSALERALIKHRVTVINARAREILVRDGAVSGVKTDKGTFEARAVILATGGKSYPATGSTGDGYRMAQALGHTITPLKPSLVPLVTEEDCAPMAGLGLKNVTLTLLDGSGKALFSELGEATFTAFGLSGPLTLSASSYIGDPAAEKYTLVFDLKPGLDIKKLDARLQRDFAENGAATFSEALRRLLPEKLIGAFIDRSGISSEKRVGEISRAERTAAVALFKAFPFAVKAFRPIDEAIITDGGVSVKEINPKTMESKLVPGLFFAGEIIDVTGFTGGFNLQVAFSTAFCAANSLPEA